MPFQHKPNFNVALGILNRKSEQLIIIALSSNNENRRVRDIINEELLYMQSD